MLTSVDNQTIIAQCTPQGSGALALLRITGVDAIRVADNIGKLSSKKLLKQLPSHTIHYGSVIGLDQQIIDNVLFLLMRSPKTFTGQDTVEISCHNNQFIIQSIIALAIHYGARLAQPGEFTKRAVLNKKIDLIQAEAINELIHAHSQQALNLSLSQLQGSFSEWVKQIEKKLTTALAIAEASFEFVDDDLEVDFTHQIKQIIGEVQTQIDTLKHEFSQQKQLRQGIKIALIGSVNAGKSSLFNALVGNERAIVTDIAGTTRDSIEAGKYVDGMYWTLVDTAGLRETTNIVEKKGIERTLDQAEQADIILLVLDNAKERTAREKMLYDKLITQHAQAIIGVYNKCDINPEPLYEYTEIPMVTVSAKTGLNIELLRTTIAKSIKNLFFKSQSPFLLNQRHYNLVLSVEHKLVHINQQLHRHPPAYELLACHIQEALVHLTELTGKTITEQALDTLFKEFCIGK